MCLKHRLTGSFLQLFGRAQTIESRIRALKAICNLTVKVCYNITSLGSSFAQSFCLSRFPSLRSDKIAPCLIVVALATHCTRSSNAQEAASSQITLPEISVNGAGDATLEPYQLNLSQPSTAGSRLNLTPLQTPASVSVISGDQIRYQGDQTILDAETRAVGISATNIPGNPNFLAARGFYGNNSVAQLYDGMQLFNAGGVLLFPTDPWNVERIEVLSGSSSVLYGTGGIGGALNVVPKEPNTTKQTEALQFSGGSFKTIHSAAELTGPITPQLSYIFDISQWNSGGWVHPDGNSRSLALSGALRYELMPEFVVTLREDYSNLNPGEYDGTPTYNNHVIDGLRYNNYGVADGYIAFRTNQTSLKEEWRVNPFISFTNDTYFITQYRRYHDVYTFTFNPGIDTVTRSNFRDISATQVQIGDHGFMTANSTPFGFKNETLMGFDVNHSAYNRFDDQSGVKNVTSSVPAFIFNQGTYASVGAPTAIPQYVLNLQQSGVFAEDHLTLTPELSLLAGVRGDLYETDLRETDPITYPAGNKYQGIYSGPGYHVGVVYNPVPNISLYGRYSVSTDPVTSLASDSASSIAFGLSPARQVEVGAKGSFLDDRLQTTLALYDIVKKNVLTSAVVNGVTTNQTAGQQSSHGIEVSASYRVTDTFRVEANGTILRAQFDSYFQTASTGGGLLNLAGYRPFLVPNQTANVMANWTFLPGWDLRGAMRFVGQRFADNTDLYSVPSYTVFDVGLRWTPTPYLNFDLRVGNITDKIYVAGTSTGVGSNYVLGEPRNITGTINLTF